MTDFTERQKKDIAYFRSHLDEFVDDKLLKGKFVVISNEEIQNSFDSFNTALEYAIKNFEKGNYIVQEIIDPRKINNFIRVAVV